MDNYIVYLIGLIAVLYIARKCYRSWTGKGGCGCGCDGCSSSKKVKPSCCSPDAGRKESREEDK